ncbi:MAG: PilZ domain-containing protein [Candidatus Omnitrophica bacterium]|nr:PilZ domain-containing protein [Candidatus Omnitrophota bacterium]
MVRNLFGFPKKLYKEARSQFRVKEHLPIKWMSGSDVSGIGKIRDISASGALIEAKAMKPFGDGTVLQMQVDSPAQGEFVPAQGRIVWSRRKSFFNQSLLCGVEFINPASEIMERLKERVSARIAKIERFDRFGDILNLVLFILAVGLGILVVRQQSSIQKTIEKSNHLMLGSSKKQADLYRMSMSAYQMQSLVLAELTKNYNTTQALLSQTESLLAQTQEDYGLAKQEVSALKSSLEQARIAGLDTSTKVLISERDDLKGQLASLRTEINLLLQENPDLLSSQTAPFQSRVDNINIQMQDLKYSTLMANIKEHKKAIGESRYKIASLKRQARKVKKEILHQRDAIGLAQGNQGYLIKDGEIFSAQKTAQTSAGLKESGEPVKKVNINVSLFE